MMQWTSCDVHISVITTWREQTTWSLECELSPTQWYDREDGPRGPLWAASHI